MVKYFAILGITACSMAVFAQDDLKEEDIKAKETIYDKPTEWSVYASNEPVSTFTINGDELWYATPTSVYQASIKKRLVQTFATLGTIPGTDVTCMTVDGKTVWIGGKNGVAMRAGNSFTPFTTKNGLPDDNVNAITAANGKVWVGTNKGLALYTGGSWKVFTTKNGLSNDKITALVTDDNGKVWAGTAKGISVYDGSSWTIHDMKKGMSWNEVKAIGYDSRKKAIWAAVGEKDVNTFAKGEWSTFMDIQEGIRCIMIDSQSRVWIGSANGLMKYNGDEWISDPKQLFIPASQVQWMQRDESGNLYYACENGVVRLANPYPY
jgi:hypothetical protein